MRFFDYSAVQVQVEEGRGSLTLTPAHSTAIALCDCRMRISGCLTSGNPFTFRPELRTDEFEAGATGQAFSYKAIDINSGLACQIEFRFDSRYDLFKWRCIIKNQSQEPVFIDRIGLLEPFIEGQGNVALGDSSFDDLSFHSNGWQSWSSSGAYLSGSRMRHSRLGILQEPMVLNPGTPRFQKRGLFSSDFFGVLGNRYSRRGLLLGFLSQREQFGSLTADLRHRAALRLWANGDHMRLDPGAELSTDWAVYMSVDLDADQPIEDYLAAVAEYHEVDKFPAAPAGWCSWYHYYENISEGIIRDNLAQIRQKKDYLPLGLVQIDDGFEAHVGDWFEFNGRFPHGVANLAAEIKDRGFIPGLWLAPFIVQPNSRLADEHSDWLLRKANGKLARPGFVWNSLGAALDLTVPEALDYACAVLDTAAHEWGFPYLKLDFLYAAALRGVYHDPTRTRAQVLRGGMEALRRTVGPETILLGCGAPLGSVLGLVQAMRIGADVSGYWKPSYFGMSLPFRKEPHMPSARNSVQNILTRAMLNRRWWVNDPDCLLVRPDSHLTLSEVQSLATAIGMTGGSVLLSDDMTRLPADRRELAAALLPPLEEPVRVLDWMDAETPQRLRLDLTGARGDWQVLAFFNWADQSKQVCLNPSDFHLPQGTYWVRSFWDGQLWQSGQGEPLFAGELPAHAPVLLALRPVEDGKAAYLGGSAHFSQGKEITTFRAHKESLDCEISPQRKVAGAVLDFALPRRPKAAEYNGRGLEWQILPNMAYRFNVDLVENGRLAVTF